ncbi:MAG: hypothetical protein DCC75_02040 [Proteobacteria bacterium]|nr:MAG: hypothetical protein DCC75_02040 [Pseudomonadota bacterium]
MSTLQPERNQNGALPPLKDESLGSHPGQARSVRDEFRNTVGAARELGHAVARNIGTVVESGARAAQRTAGEAFSFLKEGAQEMACIVMESLASTDPKEGDSVLRRIFTAVPVIGTSAKYANAWNRYHTGVEKNDEALKAQGRRECLLAMIDAGVDIAFLGSARVAKAAAKPIRAAASALLVTRTYRHAGIADLDAPSTLVDRTLQTDIGRRFTEKVLNLVKPVKYGLDLEAWREAQEAMGQKTAGQQHEKPDQDEVK